MAKSIRFITRRVTGILRNVLLGSPLRDNILIPILGEEVVTGIGNFLKEDGDALLLESGDNLLLEG